MTNRRIVLASRPQGRAGVHNFELQTVPLPAALAEGQVLVRHRWLSLDPYMRMRMEDMKSYAAPQALGETMIGGTAGVVVDSRHPGFAAGDAVVGMGGWQEHGLYDASQPGALRKVDASRVPLSAYLGAVGMPGVTAWVGLQLIVEPKAGETLLVNAASGAVGSVVGQLAKARGCRVVGIAGGPEKCAYVVDELGFDACIDHRGKDFAALATELDAAAPKGVDGLFENVGGLLLDVALSRMNAFGRVALCGMISGYEGGAAPLAAPRLILTQRLKVQGFIVSEHMALWPQALKELAAGVAEGRIRTRESIADGLENAPEAFFGMLAGRNFGKQLVKLI
jgi:NADPH-dependent curcumin reductase CurA